MFAQLQNHFLRRVRGNHQGVRLAKFISVLDSDLLPMINAERRGALGLPQNHPLELEACQDLPRSQVLMAFRVKVPDLSHLARNFIAYLLLVEGLNSPNFAALLLKGLDNYGNITFL